MKRMLFILGCCTTFFMGCGSAENAVNFFSLQDDLALGEQVREEIEGDSSDMIILDSTAYPTIYGYLYSIRDSLLNSGQVRFKAEFPWRIRIIQDDSTLNAFCAPGGYIYIYTGILKYLEAEDQLAGVLGHEMGHADLRHSTRQLTKMYGVQTLISLVAGDRALIKQVTSSLIGLSFSRTHEKEADECSVKYLCPTTYNSDAGALFFEKISKEEGARPPEILSTHPDPGNRIEAYRAHKQTYGCLGAFAQKERYQKMIKTLP
jgi:predicted Zn-dependent protease